MACEHVVLVREGDRYVCEVCDEPVGFAGVGVVDTPELKALVADCEGCADLERGYVDTMHTCMGVRA